uniref:C2H2-type domain-containing protein n=1 Tax=Cacopsylla melanoneura TaxID=428564 RepID=A0A8D8QHJ3_9HEMI
MNKPSVSNFIKVIIPTLVLLMKRCVSQEIPPYLQDMIDLYRARNFPNGTRTENVPTMNPMEYGMTTNPSPTTSYIDRYPTAEEELQFGSREVKMFTMFPDDDELVYTGPTMDPNDLLGLDLDNTDGWRYFGVNLKEGTLACPICTKKFRKEKKYYDHLLKVENMTTPVWFLPTHRCTERYKSTPVTCPDPMCKEEKENFGLLRLHLLEVHNGLPHNWNLTSEEYVRDVIKENEHRDQEEYIARMNKTRRPYVKRANVTRLRQSRKRNSTLTTQIKRNYSKKKFPISCT